MLGMHSTWCLRSIYTLFLPWQMSLYDKSGVTSPGTNRTLVLFGLGWRHQWIIFIIYKYKNIQIIQREMLQNWKIWKNPWKIKNETKKAAISSLLVLTSSPSCVIANVKVLSERWHLLFERILQWVLCFQCWYKWHRGVRTPPFAVKRPVQRA